MIKLLLILVIGLLTIGPARAQVYKWVDKDGVVHLTDNPSELPEPQRSRELRKLNEKQKQKKKTQVEDERTHPGSLMHRAGQETLPIDKRQTNGPAVDEVLDSEDGNESVDSEAYWKRRYNQAKEKEALLMKRCQELTNTRDQAKRQELLFARPKARAESQQAAKELKACQLELKQVHKMLQEIPEQARQAGVNPAQL